MPLTTLKSKLQLPQLPETVRRFRLDPVMNKISMNKLTIVTAGAGFGKTTLVSQACGFMTLKSVWYRLDHTDKDVKTFLHYLIEGIAEKYEGFGQETIMRIESARVLYREIEAVLTVFLCELEKHVQDDLFIVLDDYHLIQDSLEINEAMSFLIERFLANIHIILISRSDAVFPLSRLRAMRDVVDITEDDLSFTVSEIEDLFRCLFDVSLEEKSLLHLYRKTGGWVSGLILFYHSLKGKTSEEIETALVSMDSSQQIILTYLEENVFSLLSEELQEFLIKTSILTHIDVDFCNRLLQIENAKNILEKLVNNHLFTIPVDTQRRSYQYHHLFQEFLQTKLETIQDKTTVGILHENAAKLYEENDDIENALGHYLSAGKMDDACRLLGSIGRKLLWAGRLNLINSYLALIPESYLQNEPWIQYMQAQSLDLCGKSFQAIKAYKKALAMFRYKKSEQGETLCLMELGRNYFMTGDLQRAEDRFKELLKYENLEHQHRIDILGQMIFITSYLGKMDESDRYYDEAEKNLPDDEVLRKIYNALLHLYKSFRYHFSGDNKKALETGKKTKAVFEEMEIYQLVALYYQMASDSYWFMGDFSKGLNAAQTGLKIVEEKGFQDSYAWFLLLLTTNSSGLGRLKDSEKYGRQCLECFQEVANRQGEAAAYMALAETFSKKDDYQEAYDYIHAGLNIIGDLNLPMIAGELNGRMAELLIRDRRFDEAYPFLLDADKQVKGFKWYEFWILCLHARYYHDQGHIEPALDKLEKALGICRANNYEIWLREEKAWMVPLLEKTREEGVMKAYVITVLDTLSQDSENKIKTDSTISLEKVTSGNFLQNSKSLTIRMFGKFDAYVGDKRLDDKNWKSRHAKTLFKYFLYYRAKGYTKKDVLMELLWPDEDPSKTSNRFHVAMNSLRKTLEPDLEKGIASTYILSNGDSYRIHIGDKGFVDTETFTEKLDLAEKEADTEKTLGYYLDAESLYAGSFLEEDPYELWCEEGRAQLQRQYLGLLVKIIQYYEGTNDYSTCIAFAEKYIMVDRYDEGIYRILMRHYFLAGNIAMVKRTYEACKYSIETELDCPLSDEIRQLYNEVMEKKFYN